MGEREREREAAPLMPVIVIIESVRSIIRPFTLANVARERHQEKPVLGRASPVAQKVEDDLCRSS